MSETAFNRHAISRFHFKACAFDVASGIATLDYAFDDGAVFSERISFPGAPFALTPERHQAVHAALRTLHLIAGVSYYKAAAPETLIIDSYAIDAETAAFLNRVYENGLGEFAYRNGLNLRGKIHFPYQNESIEAAPLAGLQPHALVAIGGGKDSLVSIESLRRLGMAQTVTWIGSAPLIRSCAERTGLPLFNITRTLYGSEFSHSYLGGVVAGFRSGRVLQRAFGQLWQPDRRHRRGQSPVVEGLGFRA